MKKMYVVWLLLAAALTAGCSKKNPQTTPPAGDTQTEMKKDGDVGGASYGGAKTEPGAANPAAPK